MWALEQELFNKGINIIAGVDEAGRGPLAGPVVAAAVIVPRGYEFRSRIDDSKKLSGSSREKAYAEITRNCAYACAVVGEETIDRVNILNAALSAMAAAVNKLIPHPEWVMYDGPHAPDVSFPGSAVIDGDAKSISIASASIIAKVTRDMLMDELDKSYPQYGFARHKGYGTKEHCRALKEFGPCPVHRKTFQPVKSLWNPRA